MKAPTGHQKRDLIPYLYSLTNDKGESRAILAALRRGLGLKPGIELGMYRYIASHVPEDTHGWQHDAHYMVASLFALHPAPWPVDTTEQGNPHNFGASFAWLNTKSSSESIEKRFVALLNADREELPEHLRHAVSLLKAHEVPVDYARLLWDVRAWDAESRRVQRFWARAFWGATNEPARETSAQSNTTQAAEPPTSE